MNGAELLSWNRTTIKWSKSRTRMSTLRIAWNINMHARWTLHCTHVYYLLFLRQIQSIFTTRLYCVENRSVSNLFSCGIMYTWSIFGDEWSSLAIFDGIFFVNIFKYTETCEMWITEKIISCQRKYEFFPRNKRVQ